MTDTHVADRAHDPVAALGVKVELVDELGDMGGDLDLFALEGDCRAAQQAYGPFLRSDEIQETLR